MCARRFLMLIFILTLIVVGGAFALYQFGDQVLVRMATPQRPLPGSRPRTAGRTIRSAESWIAKPGHGRRSVALGARKAWSTATPRPSRPRPSTSTRPPTSSATAGMRRSMRGSEPTKRADLFVESQASAFDAVSRRLGAEISPGGVRRLPARTARTRTRRSTWPIAMSSRAFDAFLREQPAGKPIILAGHSQGSLHLLRLLAGPESCTQRPAGRRLCRRLAASVTDDLPAMGLPPALRPDQAGCILSAGRASRSRPIPGW